jgi:phage terminase large subunit-like protein
MFNPVEALRDNPALFACYVLFVYFRGKNAVRIEREMRLLGYTTFHRRNLYPRGHQPGWIAKYGWSGDTLVPMSVASTRKKSAEAEIPFRGGTGDGDRSVPAPPDFHSWLKRVAPNMTWDWKHQQVIIKQLEKFTEGKRQRLMIFLPPRHGKTELVSVKYTAWRMQRDPSMNVILGSYNQRLADRMSRKIRTTLCDSEAIRLGRERSGDTLVPMSVASTRKEHACTPNSPTRDAVQAASGLGDRSVPAPTSPFPFSRPRPKNAVSEWETAAGGSFRAIGSGSGVTGFGANLIVIDDPVKNRAQAESETYRNRVWDWYKDDLYTRLEPDGSIVLIQTRWHEDDLAGRLLRDNLDDWTIINLPALSERNGDTIVREGLKQNAQDADQAEPPTSAVGKISTTNRVGINQELRSSEHPMSSHPDSDADIQPPAHAGGSAFEWRTAPDIALCPERFPVEALEQQKRQLGTYAFSALYQQRPTPAGGQIFKREWFKQIIDFAPPGLKWKRGYDLAVSTSTESDYTASFRCAFDEKTGNLYISGGFRRRMEFPDQRRFIIDRMLTERDTEHGVELALHGQALIQDLRREPSIRGKSLSGVKVSTDKITRALTWSPIAEDGKVILVRSALHKPAREQGRYQDSALQMLKQDAQDRRNGLCDTEISPRTKKHPGHPVHPVRIAAPSDWISDLLDELAAFPNGTHDDQIDAISIAVQMASKRSFKSGGALIK